MVNYNTNTLPVDKKTDWKRVDAMTETELKKAALSSKETPLLDKKFWASAKLVIPSTHRKDRITIRLDSDILNWLKGQGSGYQSRINTILRTCMIHLKSESKRQGQRH